MALTTEQKRRIRKELQRRAQAKTAWKAGGGTTAPSASMKGWAGFGTKTKYKKDQLDYIKSLGAMGSGSKWKKSYKGAAKTGATKGKAKVAAYISKKGAGATRPSAVKKVTARTGGGTDISGNRPAPKIRTAGAKYTAKQKGWFAKHAKRMGTSGKTKAQIRTALNKKIAAGHTF